MGRATFAGIEIWRASFRLRLRFAHHSASRDRVETFLVGLRMADGCTGYGQALPRLYLTGETLESVLDDIRNRYWPELRKLTFPGDGNPETVFSSLRALYLDANTRRSLAAWSALDVAAFSALATRAGKSAAGEGHEKNGRTIPLVAVLPMTRPENVARLLGVLRLLGYRRFKVKVGRDEAMDAARLAAARLAAGSGAWLAVDANGAWTWRETLARREAFHRFGIALVEEPLRPEEAVSADFTVLERELGLPVMADESLCSLSDARAILARGSPAWWNLRLAKIGGFSGWRELSRLAAERGIAVYGGILVGETSLLAAAARTIWPASGAVCGEYGFPRLFLAGDPFRGGPGGFRGCWTGDSGCRKGLGVRLSRRRLAQAAELVWRDGE